MAPGRGLPGEAWRGSLFLLEIRRASCGVGSLHDDGGSVSVTLERPGEGSGEAWRGLEREMAWSLKGTRDQRNL